MEINEECWSEDYFFDCREEVLSRWPTGKEVELEEALNYHRGMPVEKIMINKLLAAKKENRTLIQPRGGRALPDEQVELLTYLQQAGEADVLPTTIDSYTRRNKYEEAEKGIKESREKGRSLLDGFPAVNHGIGACRELIESLEVPLQVRHGTPDARLLAEITLAGGFTDFEGGGISYNLPYVKNVSPADSIHYWQYVDRLVGYYHQQGVKINREPFGPLTGTLVPPAISHSIAIIEAVLAAKQGVKYISLGYGQNGNLIQDVAAVRVLPGLVAEYLKKYDIGDVELTTVFHQWLGGFPQDEARSYAVISWGATIAALSGATKVVVKTPREAMGMPGKEASAAGLKTSKQMINILKDQQLDESELLQQEEAIITEEVNQILAEVLNLGEGDLARGTVKAFQKGVLDIPYAPSKYNRGEVLPARDNKGAVRFLEFGGLPFSQKLKEFHQKKLEERGQYEDRQPGFQMVIDDVYAIGKGLLTGRPR